MTADGVRRTCYYLTFCRIPTLGLEEWKAAFRDFAEDEIDVVVLWLGGGFASRKFPITWQYNASHRNVQENFVGDLIDYAHTLASRCCSASRRTTTMAPTSTTWIAQI